MWSGISSSELTSGDRWLVEVMLLSMTLQRMEPDVVGDAITASPSCPPIKLGCGSDLADLAGQTSIRCHQSDSAISEACFG
jgi:hypothetical protein